MISVTTTWSQVRIAVELVYRHRQPLLWCEDRWFVSWFPTRPGILWHVRIPERTFPAWWEKQKSAGKNERRDPWGKMHSVLFTEENSPVGKKAAKSVSENVTRRKLWHQDYKACLFEKHKWNESNSKRESSNLFSYFNQNQPFILWW